MQMEFYGCTPGKGKCLPRSTLFFSICVFFYGHSRFTGQQRKEEATLAPLYHFHPLHRHLHISRAITAES